jgi:hypothetical protein
LSLSHSNTLDIISHQHRYYGKSKPFKSKEKILKNIGYFSSAQALADYAQVIIYIKKTFQAENSPVVVIGGSYSGSESPKLFLYQCFKINNCIIEIQSIAT